jgi:hypothetical protein
VCAELEEQRFFVVHLAASDRPSPDKELEIQLLDTNGRAASTGYAYLNQEEFELDGKIVPKDVLDAARRQKVGQGEYVDAKGESITAF